MFAGLGATMEADLRAIEANDIPDWPNWSAVDASNELQWFTLTIGLPGDAGSDLFQVVVATPIGIRQRREKGKFVGLVVDRFEPTVVETAIRDFVASCKALT
jgi:Immunity protein 8